MLPQTQVINEGKLQVESQLLEYYHHLRDGPVVETTLDTRVTGKTMVQISQVQFDVLKLFKLPWGSVDQDILIGWRDQPM